MTYQEMVDELQQELDGMGLQAAVDKVAADCDDRSPEPKGPAQLSRHTLVEIVELVRDAAEDEDFQIEAVREILQDFGVRGGAA